MSDSQRKAKLILAEQLQNAQDNCSVYREQLKQALMLAESVRDSSLGMKRARLAELLTHLFEAVGVEPKKMCDCNQGRLPCTCRVIT